MPLRAKSIESKSNIPRRTLKVCSSVLLMYKLRITSRRTCSESDAE
jgi:hypothetical protein